MVEPVKCWSEQARSLSPGAYILGLSQTEIRPSSLHVVVWLLMTRPAMYQPESDWNHGLEYLFCSFYLHFNMILQFPNNKGYKPLLPQIWTHSLQLPASWAGGNRNVWNKFLGIIQWCTTPTYGGKGPLYLNFQRSILIQDHQKWCQLWISDTGQYIQLMLSNFSDSNLLASCKRYICSCLGDYMQACLGIILEAWNFHQHFKSLASAHLSPPCLSRTLV